MKAGRKRIRTLPLQYLGDLTTQHTPIGRGVEVGEGKRKAYASSQVHGLRYQTLSRHQDPLLLSQPAD